MVTTLLTKVLLVNNDPQFAYLMKRYVDYCGCSLVQVEWAADVVNLIGQEEPSVIFASVFHPEADFIKFLRTLKSGTFTSKFPVVVCSTSEAASQDWTHEADACLIQPIMYTDFTRIISEVGLEILTQKDHSSEGGF